MTFSIVSKTTNADSTFGTRSLVHHLSNFKNIKKPRGHAQSTLAFSSILALKVNVMIHTVVM